MSASLVGSEMCIRDSSNPPRPMALATQAAPSAATSPQGRQSVHHAVPAQPREGVSHAAPTVSAPQQQQPR
eukprot:13012120-Alexandrium_andersonii.AAC.1